MTTSSVLTESDPPARRAQSRLLNVVVSGEFNSGKSSVVDLILRQPLLPISARYSGWPQTCVHGAQSLFWQMQTADGATQTLQAGDNPSDARRVQIGIPDFPFEGACITEVPIDQTGRMSQTDRQTLESADVLIWCTMAQRAWSLSEIEIVTSLPATQNSRAILAVTRSDYLRSEDARRKVSERLHRQAAEHFEHIVLINSSPEAIAHSVDDQQWKAAGGRELTQLVSTMLDVLPAPKPMAEIVALRSSPRSCDDVLRNWRQRQGNFVTYVNDLDPDATAAEVAEYIWQMVQGALDEVRAAPATFDAQSDVETMFSRALEALGQVSVGWAPQSAMLKSMDLFMQIERELAIIAGSDAIEVAESDGDLAIFHHSPTPPIMPDGLKSNI